MKKVYFSLAAAGFIVFAGCGQTANAPVEQEETNANTGGTSAQNAKESATNSTTNQVVAKGDNPPSAQEFVEYSNDEFDFKLNHPKNWEVKEENAEDGAKKITIRNSETDATGFIIFPRGGFVNDEPTGEKKEVALTFAGKPAKQSEYDNGLVIVRPQEFPASWNSDGRIELSTADPNNFYEIMTSFQFTE